MKITGKKYRMMSKTLIFGQTYMKFVVVLAMSKMIDTQLTYNFAEYESAAPERFFPSELIVISKI